MHMPLSEICPFSEYRSTFVNRDYYWLSIAEPTIHAGRIVHCSKIPVKLTVKLLAAVLPTKNRKIYGQDNDNRYFFYGK